MAQRHGAVVREGSLPLSLNLQARCPSAALGPASCRRVCCLARLCAGRPRVPRAALPLGPAARGRRHADLGTGLLSVLALRFIRDDLETLAFVAAITFFEISGPIAVRWALFRAGEARHPGEVQVEETIAQPESLPEPVGELVPVPSAVNLARDRREEEAPV